MATRSRPPSVPVAPIRSTAIRTDIIIDVDNRRSDVLMFSPLLHSYLKDLLKHIGGIAVPLVAMVISSAYADAIPRYRYIKPRYWRSKKTLLLQAAMPVRTYLSTAAS